MPDNTGTQSVTPKMPPKTAPNPTDAIIADIQESANVLMVEKAKKAAEIARLRGTVAELQAGRDALALENQTLKKKLADNGIATDEKAKPQE